MKRWNKVTEMVEISSQTTLELALFLNKLELFELIRSRTCIQIIRMKRKKIGSSD